MTDIEISNGPAASPAAPPPAPVASVDELAGNAFVTVYAVHGMSCGHCASAVTRELSALDGVAGVHVDLEGEKVTVGSARRLSDEEVREAVDEAGYELA